MCDQHVTHCTGNILRLSISTHCMAHSTVGPLKSEIKERADSSDGSIDGTSDASVPAPDINLAYHRAQLRSNTTKSRRTAFEGSNAADTYHRYFRYSHTPARSLESLHCGLRRSWAAFRQKPKAPQRSC